jgi:hypothetical protein
VKRIEIPLFAVCCSLALACSGSSDIDGPGDNLDETRDEIPLAELGEALATAYCTQMFGDTQAGTTPCCSPTDLAQIFPPEFLPPDQLATDVASCKAFYARHAMLADHLQRGVDEGRLVYDASAAAGCVNQISSSCQFGADVTDPLFQSTWWIAPALPSFCDGVAKPTGSGGCLEDIDCAEGTFCNRPPIECVEVPPGDGPLPTDPVCDGADLDDNGVCRLPNGRFAHKTCCAGVTLDCSGEAPPGKCEQRVKLGASCDDARCELGLACPVFELERVCEPPRANGEGCDIGSECESGHCEKADLNDPNATCAPAPAFCRGTGAAE